MPEDATLTKREFLEFALARFEFEHEQLIDAWKQSETKAQIAATYCGVLLAAVFAFVRVAPQSPPTVVKCAIAASAVLLVAAVGLSLSVLLVRRIFIPVPGAQVAAFVEHALAKPETEYPARYEAMLADCVNHWSASNRKLSNELDEKTSRLRSAYFSLGLCSVAVVITTLIALTNL